MTTKTPVFTACRALLKSCIGFGFMSAAHAGSGVVLLDQPGALSAWLGASIHLDGWRLQADQQAGFGSPTSPESAFSVRRAYLSLGSQLRSWNAVLEASFAETTPGASFELKLRQAYLGRSVPTGVLQLGQRRPPRGLAELTDDNHMLMIERPFASAAGSFAGGQSRQFTPGIYYFGRYDHFGWGLGIYGLRTLDGHGADGIAGSARLSFTPLARTAEIVHLGASVTWEDPRNQAGAPEAARIGTSIAYAGDRGPRATVGLASPGASALTLGLEYANAIGPFFMQAEFMAQRLSKEAQAIDEDVLVFYVEAGYALTGESRPYQRPDGVFGGLRPFRRSGAWELSVRYDAASNRDVAAVGGGCDGGPAVNRCRVQAFTLGLSYLLNPDTRLMLNYSLAEQDRGSFGTDRPRSMAARLQFSI